MNSATKVGEIFTKAGDSYNKIGDMIVMLHPSVQELTQAESEKHQVYFDQEQQQLVVSPQVVGNTITLSVGGQKTQLVDGVLTLPPQRPLEQVDALQQPILTQTIDRQPMLTQTIDPQPMLPQQQTIIVKTEVAPTAFAVQQIQTPDVSALLEAAVTQTVTAGFITSDPPLVANEEEIAEHIVH